MQPCPNCGIQLPEKASFCTRCGHALKETDRAERKQQNNIERPGEKKQMEVKNATALSAPPATPAPGNIQSGGAPVTPIPPSFQDTPPAGEAQPGPSPVMIAPLPPMKEAQAVFTAPAGGKTPLPPEAKQSAEPQVRENSPGEKTPPPVPGKAAHIEAQQTIIYPPPTREAPAAEEASIEAQKTRAVPSADKKPSPPGDAVNEARKARPASSADKKSARGGGTGIEAQKTRAVPSADKKPARSGDAGIEAQKTRAVPSAGKAPSFTGAVDIEAQKTRAIPSAGKAPSPTRAADIEAQKTRAVPSVKKALPANAADIESQKTRAVPSIRKIPPGGAADIESQKTMPVSAIARPPRSGQPGAYPRSEVYSDGTFVIYKGAQRPGAPQRNNPTQAPPGASTKIPVPAAPTRKVGGWLWRLVSPIFTRAMDAEPEKATKPEQQTNPLGWLPVMALTSALGLFTVATAYNAARDNTPGAELYFWLGLGLIFIPALVRLILPQTSRFERVGLICSVALCLYLSKVTLSPLHFNGYDEFLHWRTINDIMGSGHLFTKNALLPVSPYYPGLEIVTSAISNLSGLSTFQSGLIVVCSACLLMVLSLFLLCELLSGSARLASIATIIYMTNPHFLFFDNQFAYESMALPLATFVLFAMTRYEMLNQSRRWVMLAAWLVLMAMDFSHHLTNFVFEGLFLLWGTIYLFLRPLPLRKSIVIFTVLIGLTLTVTTVLLIGDTVVGYFTSFFSDVGGQIAQSLGSSGNDSRQLFSDAGTPTPIWERLVSLGSVGLVTLSIPFLLLCFWRRYRRNTLVWVFAIIVIFYPVLQVLRLTSSGAEASDRASAFIFIAISFLAAVAIVQFWPVRLLNWKHPALISAAILVLFMGGIILGEGIPPSFMPGPYLVSADGRSIDPQGIQAALWTRSYLGPDNRMYTDRVNQLLLSAYGDQYLVTKIGDNIDVTDIFGETTVDNYVISKLQLGQVHYLLVDLRLASGPPQDGFYFEQGEELPPLTVKLLSTFDTSPQVNRLFDNGNIAIYDTGELIHAPQKP